MFCLAIKIVSPSCIARQYSAGNDPLCSGFYLNYALICRDLGVEYQIRFMDMHGLVMYFYLMDPISKIMPSLGVPSVTVFSCSFSGFDLRGSERT